MPIDIKETLKDIEKEAEQLAGWPELKVLGVSKYGIEAVVKTDKGIVKMSMRELFIQYNFTLRVFETLGISLSQVKMKVYEEWRRTWVENIKDMATENGTSMDLLKELLESYTETAEDRDEAYLKKGEPIIISDDEFAFKSNEFAMWLKKKHSITYTDDQLHTALRDLGCTPKQIGKSRIRAWVYKVEEIIIKEEFDFDGKKIC